MLNIGEQCRACGAWCPPCASAEATDMWDDTQRLACRLEERYAKDSKRRRLAHALRRRESSNSFRNRWDHICNEVRGGVDAWT